MTSPFYSHYTVKAAFSFYYHVDWKHNKFRKLLIGIEKTLFNITKDSCEQTVHVLGNLQRLRYIQTPLFYFQFLNTPLKSEWLRWKHEQQMWALPSCLSSHQISALRSWTLALTPEIFSQLRHESEHETRKDDHHWLNQTFAPFFWLLLLTNRFNESNNSKIIHTELDHTVMSKCKRCSCSIEHLSHCDRCSLLSTVTFICRSFLRPHTGSVSLRYAWAQLQLIFASLTLQL